MKKILFIFLISLSASFAQFPIEINFNLHNDLKPDNIFYLSFGVNEQAGDSVDFNLGEQSLPPYPFSFYAALEYTDSTKFNEDGSIYYDDIRTNKDIKGIPTDKEKFYLKYKLHINWSNSNKVFLNWGTSPQNINIDSIYLKDAFNGYKINLNMKTTNSLELNSDLSIDVLYFHVYYTKVPSNIDENNKPNPQLIFPNPVYDFININNNLYSTYQIYDLFGTMLNKNFQINDNIDVSYLSKGIYFLLLNKYDGQNEIYKFIKN